MSSKYGIILCIAYILYVVHASDIMEQNLKFKRKDNHLKTFSHGNMTKIGRFTVSKIADSFDAAILKGKKKSLKERKTSLNNKETKKFNRHRTHEALNLTQNSLHKYNDDKRGSKRMIFLGNHFMSSFLKSRTQVKQPAVPAKALQTSQQQNPSKKSNINKEIDVRGQSGSLHVHTDHNSAEIRSETGKLEVYIKNNSNENAKKKENIENSRESFKTSNKLHISNDVTGLKKSLVNKVMCLRPGIPPCTLK